MKKKFLFLIVPALLLTGCIFNPVIKGKVYKGASDFFIVNPTNLDNPENGTWVKSVSRSREIEDDVFASDEESVSVLSNISIKTPTFNMDDVHLESAREADEIVKKPPVSFKVGQKKNFKNGFDSYLADGKIFKCAYESDFCYIWTYPEEDEDSKLTDEEIVEFAQKFDSLYEKQIALCGPKYDGYSIYSNIINPNTKLSIILYDIDGDKEKQWYWGYVSYNDMSRGEACDIEAIHIDSWAAKQEKTKNGIFCTLAHEFNHKLNFDNKTLKLGLSNDSWYTEMLSMLVEDFLYEDIGCSVLDSSQQRLYGFVDGSYVYGFKNWEQRSEIEGSKYCNAYAFGAYLARNYGGAELVHEICTNEYVNEESVVMAVNKINGTNLTFDDLLKGFPLILANVDGKDTSAPTLNLKTKNTISGFEYTLNPINKKVFEDLNVSFTIRKNAMSHASKYPLYAYGFQYYSLGSSSNVAVDADDRIIVVTY